MTEQDRKVSSHLEKRNHMQNPELSSEVFTDRKQRHSPRDRLLSISFPLTYTNYLFSQGKKKKKSAHRNGSAWFRFSSLDFTGFQEDTVGAAH